MVLPYCTNVSPHKNRLDSKSDKKFDSNRNRNRVTWPTKSSKVVGLVGEDFSSLLSFWDFFSHSLQIQCKWDLKIWSLLCFFLLHCLVIKNRGQQRNPTCRPERWKTPLKLLYPNNKSYEAQCHSWEKTVLWVHCQGVPRTPHH